MKWPKLPSWNVIRYGHLFAAAICLVLGVVAGPSWAGMIDLFIAGYNLQAWLSTGTLMKVHAHVGGLCENLDKMVAINRALLDDNVMMIRTMRESDDATPTAPRLH